MKMRIQGNAIRFRLNRREVEEFAQSGRASASLDFGGSKLRYTLVRTLDAKMHAGFTSNEVRIEIPERSISDWANGDEVALRAEQSLDGGGRLEITVEKDFQCLHKGEEGKDPDAFPNPMAAA